MPLTLSTSLLASVERNPADGAAPRGACAEVIVDEAEDVYHEVGEGHGLSASGAARREPLRRGRDA